MSKTTVLMMDKARNLKFGFNALIELEDALGKPIAEIGDGFRMKDFRTVLFYGLKHEDSSLTLEEVGNLMDIYIEENSLEKLSTSLSEAFTKATGGKDATPSKKKK